MQSEHAVLTRSGLDALIGALAAAGYRVCGPTLRDETIVYADIAGIADLPAGWTDHQDVGSYALRRGDGDALFGYGLGPQAWKKYLHPPRRTLSPAPGGPGGAEAETAARPFAFVGVRPCELVAIAVQDRVFAGRASAGADYRARREGAFILAVNCSQAGGTCFCVSMEAGPRARAGFDLSLTEIASGGSHVYVTEVGSDRGGAMLATVPLREATPADRAAADAVLDGVAAGMGRRVAADGIRDLLLANPDHPRWADVASRCLNCGNCTLVCPTCFCTTTEEAGSPGIGQERCERWDSCFTMDPARFAGAAGPSATLRYRQWVTHKLATWWDQFGSSGCVGCGRCITWCPVGIDITEELRAIRQAAPARPAP